MTTMTIKDGEWTLFEYTPELHRSVWVIYDSYGNPVAFDTRYEVEGLLSENEQVRNMAGAAWSGDYHRIASIPLNVVFDENLGLMKAHSEGDESYLSKWLNDSDNRAFRTKEGNV
jgi:hypothetical protein